MITLSDDFARLDFDRVHAWLAGSYWSPGISRTLVEKAAGNAHCLGAYEGGVQVGYARLISDRATFAWLADVFIDEPARGKGLGRRMVSWFLDHPEYHDLRRVMLATKDAQEVYRPLGFVEPVRPDRLMERLAPWLAEMLRTAP